MNIENFPSGRRTYHRWDGSAANGRMRLAFMAKGGGDWKMLPKRV